MIIRDNWLTFNIARLANVPFQLFGQRPFVPPKKALILQTCCLSQVMLVTPLLAVLSDAYPHCRFDWAVSDWARPAIAGNPRLTEIISIGNGDLANMPWRDIQALIERIRQEHYDTCFIPSRSSMLGYIAWRAGIPQRVGINWHGRGFGHTVSVKPPADEQHVAAVYLAMAQAAGVDLPPGAMVDMEFYPPDVDRTAVTRRLVDDVEWMGERPLIIIYPGGGTNPVRTDLRKRWPVERYVLLGNELIKKYQAQIVLVGGEAEKEAAKAIAGMMVSPAANWTGQTSLGEMGALCEIASLFIGGDSGPTHVAAAQACPTIAIFGPSMPAISRPFSTRVPVKTLWKDLGGREFSWALGVSVADVLAAAEELLTYRTPQNTSLLEEPT